jgi:hypothetical protein
VATVHRRSPRLANLHQPPIMNTAVAAAVDVAIAALGASANSDSNSSAMDIDDKASSVQLAIEEHVTASFNKTTSSNSSGTLAAKQIAGQY